MVRQETLEDPFGSPLDTKDDPTAPSIYSEAVKELVALGAAIASNCEGCFRYHYGAARKLGVVRADIAAAVATARSVKETPARAVLELAERYLGGAYDHLEPPRSCTDRAVTAQAGLRADPRPTPPPADAPDCQPGGCSCA